MPAAISFIDAESFDAIVRAPIRLTAVAEIPPPPFNASHVGSGGTVLVPFDSFHLGLRRC